MSWYDFFFFWRKKEAAPIHEPLALAESTYEHVPLSDVFMEAIQETYDEQYKLELELLNDKRLREYIKNAVKAMSMGLNKDTYDFVLIHASDVNIDSRIFPVFGKIMVKLCAEIDLPIKFEDSYLNIKKNDIRKSFDNLKKQVIDIDERARTMLSTGIYR